MVEGTPLLREREKSPLWVRIPGASPYDLPCYNFKVVQPVSVRSGLDLLRW